MPIASAPDRSTFFTNVTLNTIGNVSDKSIEKGVSWLFLLKGFYPVADSFPKIFYCLSI
jgi:hypothetical protein